MPYMIYQQYTTAVKEAYRGHEGINDLYAEAKRCRHWLEALAIDPRLRGPMVEPVRAVEEALADLVQSERKL